MAIRLSSYFVFRLCAFNQAATDSWQGGQYSTLGDAAFMTSKLVDMLKQDNTDPLEQWIGFRRWALAPQCIQSVRRFLLKDVKRRFQHRSLLIGMCSIVDPRHKKLQYLQQFGNAELDDDDHDEEEEDEKEEGHAHHSGADDDHDILVGNVGDAVVGDDQGVIDGDAEAVIAVQEVDPDVQSCFGIQLENELQQSILRQLIGEMKSVDELLKRGDVVVVDEGENNADDDDREPDAIRPKHVSTSWLRV